jgi:hypothetical protein
MEKSVTCSHCGREKRLVGQGLCSACYHRERRRKFVRTATSNPEEDFTVRVNFAPMAFLLEKLKKKAGTELREVGCQILWELNKTLGVGA